MPATKCPQCHKILDYESMDTLICHVREHREGAVMDILQSFCEHSNQEEMFKGFVSDLADESNQLLGKLMIDCLKMKFFITREN